MKITGSQKKELQKHFRDIFKFRETYEEVYDHLLTSVDNAPNDANFGKVINQTIEQDFGGYPALVNLEMAKLKEVNQIAIKSAWRYFTANFKPGTILFALGYGFSIYYLLQDEFATKFLVVLLMVILLFPYVLINIWRFKSAYAIKDAKKSIQDAILTKVAMVPYQISFLSFCAFNIIVHRSVFEGFDRMPHGGVSIVFTLVSMYCLSFYKWYKNEFKLQAL